MNATEYVSLKLSLTGKYPKYIRCISCFALENKLQNDLKLKH